VLRHFYPLPAAHFNSPQLADDADTYLPDESASAHEESPSTKTALVETELRQRNELSSVPSDEINVAEKSQSSV